MESKNSHLLAFVVDGPDQAKLVVGDVDFELRLHGRARELLEKVISAARQLQDAEEEHLECEQHVEACSTELMRQLGKLFGGIITQIHREETTP